MTPKPEAVTTSLFEEYATDVKKEEDGLPITLRNGAIVTLRAESSVVARRWLTKRLKQQRAIISREKGILPPELNDKNDIDELAEVLIVRWEGVTGRDGTVLPHSVANARWLMTELPALRRDLLLAARTDETFRADLVEEMAGNFVTSSEPTSGSVGVSTPSSAPQLTEE